MTSRANNTTNNKLAILRPIMQAGFAGFCCILLGIICWRMHTTDKQFEQFIELQAKTNSVIERNTAVITDLKEIVLDKL